MPSPNTIAEFLDLGYRSGLLDRDQVNALVETWRQEGLNYASPRALADALIHEGPLTRFQADKLHFLVLEFVDGCNLHDFIRNNGTLAPERAAHYIRQAALGLAHAHEAGLVHRDIKPGNLLLDRQGTVKLLDMGLARFFKEDSPAFIKEYEVGYIIGTGDYIAPEQIVDSRVDIRADIYSLGGTMYYLLTGKSPFQEGTNAQKIIWHQVRHPKSLRVLRPDVPEEMMQVFEKIIAKEPGRRFQTPIELAAALEPFVCGPITPPTLEEMPASVLNA